MKFLSACAKLFAAFLAILFVVSALISLLLFNAQHHFIKSNLYKRVLIEERVYDSLPRLLSTQISRGMTYSPCDEDPNACENQGEDSSGDEEGGPPDYFKNMDAEQWDLLLREILTRDWLQTQAESVIDQFFEFLESDETTPSITISLVELKTQLMGRKGVDVVLKIVNAQPACSEEQLKELKNAFEEDLSGTDLLSCLPPQEILDEYVMTIEETLDEVVGELPNDATLGDNFMNQDSKETTDTKEEDLQVGTTLRRLKTYMSFSPIVPVVILLLIVVFGVRSFRDLLRWWGIPLLLTGLIALVVSILSMPIFNWFLETYVEGQIPGYFSMELVELGFDIGRSVFRSFVKAITLQAGIMALVGLLATAMSAFIRPRRIEPVQ